MFPCVFAHSADWQARSPARESKTNRDQSVPNYRTLCDTEMLPLQSEALFQLFSLPSVLLMSFNKGDPQKQGNQKKKMLLPYPDENFLGATKRCIIIWRGPWVDLHLILLSPQLAGNWKLFLLELNGRWGNNRCQRLKL